jgi:hypothetical protein
MSDDAEGAWRDTARGVAEIAVGALKAKDAELADADHLADLQQKEIERLRAEIERLRRWQAGK